MKSELFMPVVLQEGQPHKVIHPGYTMHLMRLFQKVVDARHAVSAAEAVVVRKQADALRTTDEFKLHLAAIRLKEGIDPAWDVSPDAKFFYSLNEGQEPALPEDYRKPLPVNADDVLKGVDPNEALADLFKNMEGKL